MLRLCAVQGASRSTYSAFGGNGDCHGRGKAALMPSHMPCTRQHLSGISAPGRKHCCQRDPDLNVFGRFGSHCIR
ncbi:hypothetical protein PISMIDRAFT_683677 [Pisolithus microcarpus 441]|uniref:Uncharacterized protein n=1 Tax=Pisolithus microcarpus 441 TaxID=765257 RepID=A0A0C9YQX5_9AGAM|nr:hypothetical protein PISMIDRAFT_683677 [Pisolithus microcarpus 441]